MGVTHAHDGLALDEPPFAFHEASGPGDLVVGPRIGLTKAADTPWRFGQDGSRVLSRPFTKT